MQALIVNEDFKRQFAITFMDMLNSCFETQNICNQIDQYATILTEPIVLSHRRFFSENYDVNTYEEEIQKYKSFFEERPKYVIKHIQEFLQLGETKSVHIDCRDLENNIIKLNTIALDSNDEIWEGQYFSDYSLQLEISIENEDEFEGWAVNKEFYSSSPSITVNAFDDLEIVPLFTKK